jgi:hypothetical protein
MSEGPPEALEAAHEHLSQAVHDPEGPGLPEALSGRVNGVGFGLAREDTWELVVDLQPPEDDGDREALEARLREHLAEVLGEEQTPMSVRWRRPPRPDGGA